MNRPRTLLVLCAVGCAAPEVEIHARIGEQPGDGVGPLAGASVELLDDEGELYSTDTSSDGGDVTLRAPRGETVHVIVDAPGHVPASFMGVSGLQPSLDVGSDVFFGVADALHETWVTQFDGCPGIGDGGFVLGEIRAQDLTDPVTGEHPLVDTASVYVEGADEQHIDACYLDDDGVAYDPQAEQTGATGRFLVPGLPPGRHLVVIRVDIQGGFYDFTPYELWMPEEGVAPWLPTWVYTPLPG